VVQHMFELVRERSNLRSDDDDHKQRADRARARRARGTRHLSGYRQ
jgi:hypothetical protein